MPEKSLAGAFMRGIVAEVAEALLCPTPKT
jgi:hypothetical protein